MTIDPSKFLRQRQQEWARARGLPFDDDGYVARLEDHLFVPMSDATLADFKSGSGRELGAPGVRGKLQALHSSSALAVNAFEYWREQGDRALLSAALDISGPIEAIRFEAKFSTGLGGPANLDVILELSDETIAIESKFAEPFDAVGPLAVFSPRYFSDDIARWASVGLPRCQRHAEEVASAAVEYMRLNAPQLLKHALGLWRQRGGHVSLWYLYFQQEGPAGVRHEMEITRFREAVGTEIRFRAIPYQVLIGRFERAASDRHHAYVDYLRGRYGVAN